MSQAIAAFSAWDQDLDARPSRDPRRIGRLLLGLGGAILLIGVLLTPPWVYAGLALATCGAVLGRAPLGHLPGVWLGVAFTAWVVVSMLAAWSAGIAGARLLPSGAAYLWLATPLVGLGLAGVRVRRPALAVVAVVATAAVIAAVLQFTCGLGKGFLKIDPAGVRLQVARGFSESHLTFGLLGALLLVAAAQFRTAWGLGAGAAWTTRAVAAVGLAVCGSRAAMLGAIVGVWASFSVRGRRWAVIGISLAVLLGGVLALRQWLTDPGRFAQTIALQDGRWPIWRTALRLAGERPILGLGGKDAFLQAYPAAFQATNPGLVSEFPQGAPHAHNAALALATEYGLPALGLHVAFWTVVLIWLWRRRHAAPDAWRLGVGVAGVALVGGLFEPYPTRLMQSAAIHACLGLAVALALTPSSVPAQESP